MVTGKEKVYVFDVCGTLFRSNTTYDFLCYYFKKKNKGKYALCRIGVSLPSKVLITVFSKMGVRVGLRPFLIALLQDENVEEVGVQARAFVLDYLYTRKNVKVHDILDQALEQQKRVVLASASLDPVVKAIAEDLHVKESIASVLGQGRGPQYTGVLVQDIKGNKLSYLQSLLDLNNTELVVITDNLDDIALIQSAGEAHIVSKNRHLQKWKSLLSNHPNAEFIHV